MSEVPTTPLQREHDALLSIQNALALFPMTKRTSSHCTVSTASTVSSSSSPSRSLQSDRYSCDDSNDDADSSEQTVVGFYVEQAVINSIAETLSSQDAPEDERPETAVDDMSNSHISDLSHAVEEEYAPTSGSVFSQMFFTSCMGGNVFSTSMEPQSTGQDTMSGRYSRDDYHYTIDYNFASTAL
jgi:hypothetical protein